MAIDLSVLSLAVMTLRLFEKEAARKRDEMKETQHIQNKQLKETEKDKNLVLVRQ